MDKYINLNSFNNESGGVFSRIMKAGGSLNTNTWIIICCVISFGLIAILYYIYIISPSLNVKYKPNSEQVPIGSSNVNKAELLFFYADWCPHCKAAKPIWNDLKTEYENKTINGYQVLFTEIDCSEESAEVEKLMNQYNIEGYPTIKLLKDGQIIEYDAKPSKDTLIQFLNTVL